MMPFKSTFQTQQCLQALFAYFLTLTFLIICAVFLVQFIPDDAPASESLKALFVVPKLYPETKERTIFVCLIALLLPLNFLAIQFTKKLQYLKNKIKNSKPLQKTLILTIPFTLIFLVDWDVLFLITSCFHPYWQVACFTVVSITALFIFDLNLFTLKITPFTQKIINTTLITLFSLAVLLVTLSFRVLSVFHVNENGKWTTSFEAVFYSVSQAVAGQTLLVNLPAQYGLYAEILSPIFKISGLSVLSFTSVMTFLQIIGLFTLSVVCWQLIKYKVFRLFSIIGLCFITGGTWTLRANNNHPLDEYYQYWPVRFLFPALAVYAFYECLKQKQNAYSFILIAGLSGVACTWNLDSGIPVLGALIAYLLLQIIFPVQTPRSQSAKNLALLIAVVIIGLIAFGEYLQFKSGMPIHWLDWIKYQKIFYQAGFFMIPLNTHMFILDIDAWVIVIGVYIFAITGTVSLRMRHQQSLVWDMLFFMSIIGLGLFTYYQGRSNIMVLTGVIWPALLISFILADNTLRAVKAKLLSPIFMSMVFPTLPLGGMLTTSFIDEIPMLFSQMQYNYNLIMRAEKTPITENIAFIRNHVLNAQQAVIISQHQAVYFAETGLKSAVNGASLVETILVADREYFFHCLLNQPVEYLFVEQGILPIKRYTELLKKYQVKSQSKYGMIYLSPNRQRKKL